MSEKMEMTYELWDFETGNAVGGYPTMAAALDVVQGAVMRDGEATLQGLALFEAGRAGERRLIARDRDLLPLIQIPAAAG